MITLNTRALTPQQAESVAQFLEQRGFTVATTDEPLSPCVQRAPWKYSPHDFEPGPEADALVWALQFAGVPKAERPPGDGYEY